MRHKIHIAIITAFIVAAFYIANTPEVKQAFDNMYQGWKMP